MTGTLRTRETNRISADPATRERRLAAECSRVVLMTRELLDQP